MLFAWLYYELWKVIVPRVEQKELKNIDKWMGETQQSTVHIANYSFKLSGQSKGL